MNERVQQFLDSLFESADVDFVVISNGPEVPVPAYVKFIQRPNIGHDFGAWSDGLLDAPLAHDYYIFVNSSAAGPFRGGAWTEPFIAGLSDDIKLFGCTINALGGLAAAHIQSYAFSMDQETAAFLIEKGIFSKEYISDHNTVVMEKEIRMSRLIIENGWNMGCLLKLYEGVDWRVEEQTRPFYTDVMYLDFEGQLWKRDDLVFIKGNRPL